MDPATFTEVVSPVVFPWAFVVLMNVLEGLIETLSWQERLIRVGWDMSVLSFGTGVGVFSNQVVIAHYSAELAMWFELTCVFVSFLAVIVILYLRRSKTYTGVRGLTGVFVGAIALGVPIYMHTRAYGVHPFGLLLNLL